MNKENKYKTLLIAAKVLIYKDVDDIANMANISRLLMDHFPNHWIGFYRVQADKLILGPFQGPIACTSIGFGKGVCGAAWQTKQTQIVDDVHQYPGHIECSALGNSEIVVPCIRENSVYAVLDVDSTEFNAFDETDQRYLEELVTYL